MIKAEKKIKTEKENEQEAKKKRGREAETRASGIVRKHLDLKTGELNHGKGRARNKTCATKTVHRGAMPSDKQSSYKGREDICRNFRF